MPAPLPDRQTIWNALVAADQLPPDRRRAYALAGLARRHRRAEQHALDNLNRRPRPKTWR